VVEHLISGRVLHGNTVIPYMTMQVLHSAANMIP